MSERWLFIHPFQLRLQRGIEVYLWNLALALARSGVEVTVLTWDGALEIPEYARHPSVRVLRAPSVRYFQAAFAVPFYVFHLLAGNYSHVFVHFAGYGEGMALRSVRLIRRLDFSIVFHFPPSLVPHRYREFERWNFQRDAVHLIAVSQATAKEVEQWSGRSCTAIGHGVDTERFKPDRQLRIQVRQQMEIPLDAPVLISVAALEERKGIQWGIMAQPQLLQEYPTLQYIVVGDGAYRRRLESLAAELGVDRNVHFIGAQLDVKSYLCAADVMLVLSKGEANSISLLEAMACRLASIVSARPPFDKLLRDGCGIKVNEEDNQQVSAVLLDLLKNTQYRNNMGKAAREFVVEHHQWSRVAEQYRALVGAKQ